MDDFNVAQIQRQKAKAKAEKAQIQWKVDELNIDKFEYELEEKNWAFTNWNQALSNLELAKIKFK